MQIFALYMIYDIKYANMWYFHVELVDGDEGVKFIFNIFFVIEWPGINKLYIFTLL